MKKILGVSFAAMLAVSPMMAMADPVATASASKVTANGTGIASTSYVQGAYNAAIDVVAAEELRAKGVEGTLNNLSEAITSDLTEKNQDVNLVNAINSVASAASDAYQLKANSNVAANGNYIVSGTGVATNLGNLDTQLKTVSDRTANYTTDLAAKQDASDSQVTTTALTDAGLIDGTDLTSGQGVGANLVTVATKAKAAKAAADAAQADVDALETTVIGLSTGSATKEGVVATINKSGVTVYQDWNAGGTPSNPTTVNVQAGGASHNEYYATIASTTGVAQPEPVTSGSN